MREYVNECYLNVPLNAKGKVEHEYCDPPEMPNVWNSSLVIPEYNLLYPVFYEWSIAFHLLIDIYEEEELPQEKTREALAILERHMRERPESEFLEAAQKLKIALNKAIELDMPLYLDF